ncbi:MAG: CotH kinase family protein [Alistipes sp.]
MMKLHTLSSLCLVSMLALNACVKSVDPAPKPDPNPNPDGVITYDDLKVNSFMLRPENNERIFGALIFNADATGMQWSGQIDHYKTDLSKLKITFDVVATKVTVGDAVQESGITANNFTTPVTYRLYADDGRYKEYTVTLTAGKATGFPILAIMTENEKPVTSREDWVKGRMVLDKQLGDCEELVVDMEIKGRGHNSWSKDKKPYAIKLAAKSPVMGMNKHKRWVLLANASDRTLLRNRVAFEIGRHTGLAWTPDSRYVDVILNGKFLGSYLLCEHIRVDKNRVNITEMSSTDQSGEALTGGYLLECDRYYDDINKFRTHRRDLPINIKEPDEDVLTATQKSYITDYVNHIEELLYANATADPHYADFIDVDSFIDWWIVCELAHNRDIRLPGSCHMYKDRSGKLFAGPLWDFDLATFISSSSFLLMDYEISDFSDPHGDRSLWYKRLFSDPTFRARAKERWQALKPAFDGIPAFIDAEAAKLQVSATSNWELWTLTAGMNQDELLPWSEAVTRMKNNYTARLRWMDGEMAKL